MIRRPPRSTLDRSSAASDVYKRQAQERGEDSRILDAFLETIARMIDAERERGAIAQRLSLIHISEPTRPY